ncbi:MAG: DUF364 domain-containing protein [Deltaproteobacteria bacterium]|nr:DUF364 domain-containing protein [Deltaproteobacteria bacterium]MBW2054042.1 DUF364 domain-containing protein [Deltaproteobacteria bacterium]MBW2142471.1 DUF364 domain-containing protein [Deltaproteobacteria bacterium]
MNESHKEDKDSRLTVLDELLQTLPKETLPVKAIRVGPFLTMVCVGDERVESSGCGLASTLATHEPGRKNLVREVGTLEDLTAQKLAGLLKSNFPLEASIGLAALNAILEVPSSCYEEKPAIEMVFERGRNRRVAVVGHFPFVKKLRQEVKELHVLELKDIPGDLPSSKASEILPACDVIVLTATVLMNGTYREMLPLCDRAFMVMMGPSAPASPILWYYGVDVLAGSTVVDPGACLRAVSQGAGYRDLKGVKKWTWKRKN